MGTLYSIEISPTGFESLDEIKDKKTRGEIAKAIDGLHKDPHLQGKLLSYPLEEIRSLKAVRSRFRILYRVHPDRRAVSVLLVGERKAGRESDVYAVARRLLRTLLGGEEE